MILLFRMTYILLMFSLIGCTIVLRHEPIPQYPVETASVQTATYPAYLANAPQDSLYDKWGMSNRECVSYVAWKVATIDHDMPTNWIDWVGSNRLVANAANWPTLAQQNNIPTGTFPRINSVAVLAPGAELDDLTDGEIMQADSVGHVMWVESINTDGTITVSQYNSGGTGEYSVIDIPADTPLTYIYF